MCWRQSAARAQFGREGKPFLGVGCRLRVGTSPICRVESTERVAAMGVLGNAQTNPVLFGWWQQWRARARAINNWASSQAERRTLLPPRASGQWTAVEVKSKGNLEKPKAKTRMRADERADPGKLLWSAVWAQGGRAVDTHADYDCPLVSASSISSVGYQRSDWNESMPTRVSCRASWGDGCALAGWHGDMVWNDGNCQTRAQQPSSPAAGLTGGGCRLAV